jgi:hypothetical protein
MTMVSKSSATYWPRLYFSVLVTIVLELRESTAVIVSQFPPGSLTSAGVDCLVDARLAAQRDSFLDLWVDEFV